MNKYIRKRLSRTETRDLHRIIMEEHLGRRLKKNEVVHHIDGNKANNAIENLQLMTREQHARLHYKQIPYSGTITGNGGKKGQNNSTAKLTDQQVGIIRELLHDGKQGIRRIASQFHVAHTTILDIKFGRTWAHL